METQNDHWGHKSANHGSEVVFWQGLFLDLRLDPTLTRKTDSILLSFWDCVWIPFGREYAPRHPTGDQRIRGKGFLTGVSFQGHNWGGVHGGREGGTFKSQNRVSHTLPAMDRMRISLQY